MDQGLRQRDVAELISCSTATILGWEVWGRQPGISQWPAIIEFLGYDPVAEEPTTFAELLKTARRRLGCSHRDLGERLKLDPSAIYKWEKGHVPKNVSSWEKLEPMFEALAIGLEIRRGLWPKRYIMLRG